MVQPPGVWSWHSAAKRHDQCAELWVPVPCAQSQQDTMAMTQDEAGIKNWTSLWLAAHADQPKPRPLGLSHISPWNAMNIYWKWMNNLNSGLIPLSPKIRKVQQESKMDVASMVNDSWIRELTLLHFKTNGLTWGSAWIYGFFKLSMVQQAPTHLAPKRSLNLTPFQQKAEGCKMLILN